MPRWPAGPRPAAGAFTVKVNGSAVSLAGANAVSVSGRQVTLTLASAVAAGDDVTVSYEKPASNWLRNVTCEYAESFSEEPVLNFTGVSRATAAIISDPGGDDTYSRGDVVRVRLTFSEAVNVTGKPGCSSTWTREDDAEDERWARYEDKRWARYESGSGTNSLTFAYTVSKGNLRNKPDISTEEGIEVIANSLRPSGGALRYASSGDPAYLAHTGLDHNANHKVDWRAPPPGVPWVSGVAVTSSPPAVDDTYILDDTIRVTLTFSEGVDVTGVPRLKIKMDPNYGEQWADYESGSGTTKLVFAYRVAEPNHSPHGIAVPEQWLDFNEGAVRSVGTAADAHRWFAGLDHDPDHKVDWRLTPPEAPAVSGVAVTSDAGDDNIYVIGDTIQVTLTFSEGVDVTGAPRLKIKMDPDWGEFWADYESGGGTSELVFAYRVAEPNTSPRGIAVLEHSLELNGGGVRSADTQTNANLWHRGLDHDPKHKVDWRLPPGSPLVSGVAVSSDPATGDTYTLGETIRVTLTFSAAVNVTGTPRLKIKMGANWGENWATYRSGSGGSRLVFDYRVAEPDTSPQGIAVLARTLQLNGGTIRSVNTQTDAHLWHPGLDHDPNHKVDWQRTGDCPGQGGC